MNEHGQHQRCPDPILDPGDGDLTRVTHTYCASCLENQERAWKVTLDSTGKGV